MGDLRLPLRLGEIRSLTNNHMKKWKQLALVLPMLLVFIFTGGGHVFAQTYNSSDNTTLSAPENSGTMDQSTPDTASDTSTTPGVPSTGVGSSTTLALLGLSIGITLAGVALTASKRNEEMNLMS